MVRRPLNLAEKDPGSGRTLDDFSPGNSGRLPPRDPLTGPLASVPTHHQLLSLLGPLVPAVLRDADGSLDLSKFPKKSFEVFREFLITQVKADGIAFNEHWLDSYHKVLGKEEYRPLLEGLFDGGEGPKDLLQKFTAEIIEVSAQKFVASHIQNETGRQRIRSVLFDKEHYTQEIRADVAKAVAQAGYEMGGSTRDFQEFNRQLSVMNYGNIGVSEGELAKAGELAGKVLDEVGGLERGAAELQGKYIESPGTVERFAGLERELGRKITDEEIKAKAKVIQGHPADLNPISQLKTKLCRLWLTVVDDGNWKVSHAYKTGANGAILLKRTEELIKRVEEFEALKSFEDSEVGGPDLAAVFVKLCEEVRDFLNGGMHVTGEGVGKDLKDFFSSVMVSAMFSPLPQAHRAGYEELKQLVDEIHYATEMGETVSVATQEVRKQYLTIEKDGEGWTESAFMARVFEAKHQFLQGLHQAKRQLWFAYKQHRALSRGISQVASWFDGGDIAEIQKGQEALDALIQQVEEAKDPGQIRAAVHRLQDQLKEDGNIQGAIRAAEMDGNEQLLGLGQTILILLASRGIYRGVGALRGAGAVTQGTSEAGIASSSSLAQKIWHGARAYPATAGKAFGLGAYLSAAENTVAASTGEVRPNGEHWLAWGKDSLATGAAMALFAPLATHYGSPSFSTSLLQRSWLRYTTGGFKIAGRIGGDAVLETGEEFLDAYLRAKMDDGNAVIGLDQAREIAMVSALGGFTKMGVIGEMLKPSTADALGVPPGGGGGRPMRNSGIRRLPSVEGSESLAPPSLLPKSSRNSLFDFGFLKTAANPPLRWNEEQGRLFVLGGMGGNPFSNPIDLASLREWLSQNGGHILLGATVAYGLGNLAWKFLQSYRRRSLVTQAMDGNDEAYQEIYQEAAKGDRKALAALAEIGEYRPQAVIDLDGLRGTSRHAPDIEYYFQWFQGKQLLKLAERHNDPQALHALLILAAEDNGQAKIFLERMDLRTFITATACQPHRFYLLQQVASGYGNKTAEQSLQLAHNKFDWGALDAEANLWPVVLYFAQRGYGRELKEIQVHDFKSALSELQFKGDRSGFIREVLISAAAMGNVSAREVLTEWDLTQSDLPKSLEMDDAEMLAGLAEWGNPKGWSELATRASREDLATLALIHLSSQGLGQADDILKALDLKTILRRLPHPMAVQTLVELEIWGHPEIRKLWPELIATYSEIEQDREAARSGPRAHQEFNTLRGRLDQEFQHFIQNYTQLQIPARQHLRDRIFQAWLALSVSERVEAYRQGQLVSGGMTTIPIPFVLQKAQEMGFHSFELKDLKDRPLQPGRALKKFGPLAVWGLLSASQAWQPAASSDAMLAAFQNSFSSNSLWGLGAAVFLGVLGSAFGSRRRRGEPPPLYVDVQAQLLRLRRRLEESVLSLSAAWRKEAEGMLEDLARMTRWNIPPWAIKRGIETLFNQLTSQNDLRAVKEFFRERQEDYITELAGYLSLTDSEQYEQCLDILGGVLDQMDQRAAQVSLLQLIVWYDGLIKILQQSMTAQDGTGLLKGLVEFGKRLEEVKPPGQDNLGRAGWFMGAAELRRAMDRLYENARNRSYHFNRDFADLSLILKALRKDPNLDPSLKSVGTGLEAEMFEKADGPFLAAIEASIVLSRSRTKDPGPALVFLKRVAREHPDPSLQLQANSILAKLGISL